MAYPQPQQTAYQNQNQNVPISISGGDDYSTYGDPEQEFIKIQVDVEPILDNFEHRVLRGEYMYTDKSTGAKYWKQMSSHSIINEIGIRELMSRIMGKVTVAAKLTYKTDDEIYKDMFFFDMSITELIAKRSDLWECDIEVAKSIKDSAVELVWDIVASARNGFTAINLRSQYTRSDISRVDTQGKSGGEGKSFLGIPLGKR